MKRALLALLLTATPALAFPVTVKSCNRDVTFDQAPARAIANDVNLIEMMLALGLRDRMIVAEDPAYALHRWNGRELVSFYDFAGAHTMLAKYDANLQPLVRELKAERPR